MQKVLLVTKYSGKAKDVIVREDGKVELIFRDSITAFDGKKTDKLEGKGRANCKTTVLLFELLEKNGIPTHYISKLSETSLICDYVNILPVEVVCRNITAGSFCRRYGIKEGEHFPEPLIEFFYKDDELHDPLVNKEASIKLGWVNKKQAMLMEAITRATNKILIELFNKISLQLVDFKLEFGITNDGRLVLADEISADSMRLWEKETGEIKDKDRYRKNLGDVIKHYDEINNRLSEIKPFILDLKTKIVVSITLKSSVLDPAGEVTHRALKRLGYENLELVRLGKCALLEFTEVPSDNLVKKTEKICKEILSNPLIEDFEMEVVFEE